MKIIYKFMSVLLIGVLLPIVAIGFFAYHSMVKISDHATEQAVRSMLAAAESRIHEITAEKAGDVNRFFAEYQAHVASLRQYFEYINTHYDLFTVQNIPDQDLYAGRRLSGLPAYGYIHPVYGCYADFERRGQGCPWLPKRVVTRLATDEKYRSGIAVLLHKTMLMNPLFMSLAEDHKETLDLAWIVTDEGVTNVFPPYDYNEIIRRDAAIIDINESEKEYVRLVNQENNPGRQIRWLEPYLDQFKNIWMSSCIAPLYDNDRFMGAIGIDIVLPTITDKILNIHVENEGYAFLVSSSGKIISLPEAGIRDMLWDETHRKALRETFLPPLRQKWTPEMIDALRTMSMDQTPDRRLRALIESMKKKESGTVLLRLSGQDKIISFAPLESCGWSLGVVVPVQNVLAPAGQIRKLISQGTVQVERTFMLLLVVMVAISGLMCLQLHYRIIRPLVTLTGKIARVRWETMEFNGHGARRKDEIGQLYAKFNEMLGALKRSRDEVTEKAGLLKSINDELQAKSAALFAANQELEAARDRLKRWAEDLEQKVRERTAELERAQERMVRVEKLAALGKLAGSLSHELRNPLGVIANAVYYLTLPGGMADELSQKESLYIIKRQVEIANRIIENALDFANPKPLEAETANINRIIDTVLADTVVPRGVKVVRQYQSTRDISCDPYLIQQLFSNIIRNSIQSIKNDGKITIATVDEKYGVKVVVEDTGSGIAAEDLGKIGEPLFSRKPRGIGLGLYIAKNIVERHHGSMRIDSEEGKGTVVTVRLPF